MFSLILRLFFILFPLLVLEDLVIQIDRSQRVVTTGLFSLGILILAIVRSLQHFKTLSLHAPQTKSILFRDFEYGNILLALVFLLFSLTGGTSGALYPISYIYFAYIITVIHTKAAIILTLLFYAYEILYSWRSGNFQPVLFLTHVFYGTSLLSIYYLFVRSRWIENITSGRKELEVRLQKISQDAHDFRVISSPSLSGSEIGNVNAGLQKRAYSSIEAIRSSISNLFSMVRQCCQLDTALLLIINPNETHFKIKELYGSEKKQYRLEPILAREGVFGAIYKSKKPVRLFVTDSLSQLPYHTKNYKQMQFIGVPVLADQTIEGIVCLDRNSKEPFGEEDEKMLLAVSKEVHKNLEVERLFSQMDKTSTDLMRFREAFSLLNEALTPEDTCKKLAEAIQKVVSSEFTAVTMFDKEKKIHRIVYASDTVQKSEAAKLIDFEFPSNTGMVAAVINSSNPFPNSDFHKHEPHKRMIFTKDVGPLDLQSLKIYPLVWGNEPIGTLVLGSRKIQAFSFEMLNFCDTLRDHAAIALANAKMYRQMEQMATTDSLTKLCNRRHFNIMLSSALERANRFKRQTSLLFLDIDHFKSVNDTYGHNIGDIVLKRVASVLEEQARKTDCVGRLGGEEFTILMEETPQSGAYNFAERIRKKIAIETFHVEGKTFHITISIGLATFPNDAKDKETLMERADKALYSAKNHGRNQVAVYSKIMTIEKGKSEKGK